jgi:hypothetical protein
MPTPTPTPTPAPTPTPTPTPTSTPTGINYQTAEYASSNAAVVSSAISAYKLGATGKGIKLAVIDSGINTSLSEFAGRIDLANSGDVTGAGRALADEGGHGSAVSATAAANKDGVWMHGVAFDATIVALRADTPGSCTDTKPDAECSFNDSAIAAGISQATRAGARVINVSLGGSAPGTQLRNALAQAVNAGIVIVMSAGNDGEKPEGVNADPFAAVPASLFPGMVIVAGSIGTFNRDTQTTGSLDTISPFSNKAGTASASALFALGAGVKTIDQNGGRFFYSGTSFAAPTITGAVALMAQLFPNLTGRQIVDLLFRTADDLGEAGTDAVYGRGRLNLSRAVQPVGTLSLAGTSTAVTGSSGDAPPASGDATGSASMGAVVLDGFDRAFAIDLAKTIRSAEQSRPLEQALGSRGIKGMSGHAGPLTIAMTVAERPNRAGFAVTRAGIGPEDARRARMVAGSVIARLDRKTQVALGFGDSAKSLERQLTKAQTGAFLIARDVAGDPGFAARRRGSMALRHNLGSVGVTLSGENGEVQTDRITSATGSPYRWTSLALDRSFGSNRVSLGVGRLDEKQSLLGGRLGAVLGGGGSSSTFVDVEARRALGSGFSAGLSARRGWTSFAGGKFSSGAYGVDVNKLGLLGAGDRLGLRVSQPLRIENGGFAMLLPTEYSYDTLSPTFATRNFSLAPKGREIDTELSYSSPLLDGSGWLGGNLFVRRQPGHYANADADIGAAIRFSLGF